jgi:autotransporter translocation and assembly factor TamB
MKIRLALLSCALAVAAFAADVTGKWTAEVAGRGGNTMTQTFTLKADGAALTGTVSGGRGGDASITNGKVDGDTISFDVTREMGGNSVTMHYSGKVAGDEIKFKMEREGGQAREFTAKRASTT